MTTRKNNFPFQFFIYKKILCSKLGTLLMALIKLLKIFMLHILENILHKHLLHFLRNDIVLCLIVIVHLAPGAFDSEYL